MCFASAGCPLICGNGPRATAFIGHPVFLAHAQREMRVVIEKNDVMWSLYIKKSTSGFFSASQRFTGS